MSLDPHNELAQVHPDLVSVMTQAAQTPQAFQIVCGIRTPEEQAAALASGNSRTKNSRHLPCERYGGVSMAIDFACLDAAGKIDWTIADDDGGIYGTAALQILAAAEDLGIPIQWGGQKIGAWTDGKPSTFRDWGHVQLSASHYPA